VEDPLEAETEYRGTLPRGGAGHPDRPGLHGEG
jgi:hypothetical protein